MEICLRITRSLTLLSSVSGKETRCPHFFIFSQKRMCINDFSASVTISFIRSSCFFANSSVIEPCVINFSVCRFFHSTIAFDIEPFGSTSTNCITNSYSISAESYFFCDEQMVSDNQGAIEFILLFIFCFKMIS